MKIEQNFSYIDSSAIDRDVTNIIGQILTDGDY